MKKIFQIKHTYIFCATSKEKGNMKYKFHFIV